MTETKGMGVMNTIFLEYGPHCGDIKGRRNGVLISKENDTTVAYALDNLQERGVLFLGPGEQVYAGQIIGLHCREDDLVVNPAKGKKLTNMRASGSDDAENRAITFFALSPRSSDQLPLFPSIRMT